MFRAAGPGVQGRRAGRARRRGGARRGSAGCCTVPPGYDRAIERRMRKILRRSLRRFADIAFDVPADARSRAGVETVRAGAMRAADGRNGVRIDDTFAEASTCARPRSSSPRRQRALGASGGASRMTGFATSVIGCGCEAGIDAELDPAADAGRPPGRARAAVRGLHRRTAEAAAEPRRPMRADQPGLGLLCRACRRGGAQARRCAALFRRRLADLQALRRTGASGASR